MELNKFKIATICVLCLFLFVIGVMYSNTKDIVNESQNNSKVETQNLNVGNQTGSLVQVISELSSRVDRLEAKVNRGNYSQPSNSGNMNCYIKGNLTDNGVDEASAQEAIRNAQTQNSQIVVVCSLN